MRYIKVHPIKENKPEPEDFGLTHEKIQNMFNQSVQKEKSFWFICKIGYILFFLFLVSYCEPQPREYFMVLLISVFMYWLPVVILYSDFTRLRLKNGRVIIEKLGSDKTGKYESLSHYNLAVDEYNKQRKFINTIKNMTKESFWINKKNVNELRENLYDLFLSCNYYQSKQGPYCDSFIFKKNEKSICLIYGYFLKFSQRYASRARIYKGYPEIWLLSITGYDNELVKIAKKYNMKLLMVSDLTKMAKMYLKSHLT